MKEKITNWAWVFGVAFAIASTVFGYGLLTARVDNNVKRIDRMEIKLDDTHSMVKEIHGWMQAQGGQEKGPHLTRSK